MENYIERSESFSRFFFPMHDNVSSSRLEDLNDFFSAPNFSNYFWIFLIMNLLVSFEIYFENYTFFQKVNLSEK